MMMDRLILIATFAVTVAAVWSVSMLSTPRKGLTKVLERTAIGTFLCWICYLALSPLGITIPQTPVSALLAGYLGLPGVAFSTFVSMWP